MARGESSNSAAKSAAAAVVDEEPTAGPGTSASLDVAWGFLEKGVDRMMKRASLGMSYSYYMLLYTACYNYCVQNKAPESQASTYTQNRTGANLMGADLYNKLTEYFNKHLEELSRESKDLSQEALLQFYADEWTRYTIGATYVNRLFTYLNRHWVKREKDEGRKGIYPVYTLALIQWKEHWFMRSDQMSGEHGLVSAMLKLVEQDRQGQQISKTLIKTVTNSMVSLGIDESDVSSTRANLDVYKNYFQARFLDATDRFYKRESETFLQTNSVSDYIQRAVKRLLEEEERVDLYLHSTTKKALILRCETVLIASHMTLLQKEFKDFLKHDKSDGEHHQSLIRPYLYRIWGLLSRIAGGLDPLRSEFEDHVKESGRAEAERVGKPHLNAKNKMEGMEPKPYIQALIGVHQKNAEVVEKSFRGEQGFKAALDKACAYYVDHNFVTEHGDKTPEVLAAYVAALLQKGNKDSVDANAIEGLLNQAMIIFKFVSDKDVFQASYKNKLARRLVQETSESPESEASMISKLKEACGVDYTIKLQNMFTDMQLSKDATENYKEKMRQTHSAAELAIDFSVVIGGSNTWPFKNRSDFAPPKAVQADFERFNRYYNSAHSGRKLSWHWHLHRTEIRMNWPKQKVTLLASGYQAGILMLFNNLPEPVLTYDEIKTATKLPDDELEPVMKILIKVGLLKESDKSYTLNLKQTYKKLRLNINLPIRAHQKVEASEVLEGVEEARKFVYQATVVRLMKARQTLTHQVLVAEVINQLNSQFTPKVPEVKKAIDHLLDKEYMERMEGSRDTYKYLA